MSNTDADPAAGDGETRLAAAMLRLSVERPYLSTALWSMQRVARPGIGTLGVDAGWRLHYDPALLGRWSVAELQSVLYHEVCHLLRAHMERADALAADPLLFNLAADAEINDDLRAESLTLPGSLVYPERFDQPEGRLAEEYYAAIEQRVVWVTIVETGPGAGRCGGAAGRAEPWEADGVNDVPSLTDVEARILRRQVAHAIQEHEARRPGTVPGHLSRWAEARLQPAVDWRRELTALIRRGLAEAAGLVDYTYARPSRRQPVYGPVVMPALRAPRPRVAVVVDTSGSMDQALLARALAEVAGILRAAGHREGVQVLAVDAAVHESRRAFRVEDVRLTGGGGTDMGAGIAACAALRPRPEVAIVLTDGYTPWPERPPLDLPVVVALLGSGSDPPPAWARCVRIRAS